VNGYDRQADVDAVCRGRTVGVDVGRARVGLAAADPDGLIATPLRTLRRDQKKGSDLRLAVQEVLDTDAVAVYVGLPLNLQGRWTPSTEDAVDYARRLADALAEAGSDAAVRLVDERMSTVSAQRQLQASGRTVKDSRAVIDQAAAVAILQAALDTQRRTGAWAGDPVSDLTEESTR